MEAPAASTTVISVRGLRMGYGAHVLLENASFDVRRGEILVILGGSGSGKSSLMKNMIGLQRPMAGDISIAGKSIVNASPAQKAALQRSLGVMYQSGALFGSLSDVGISNEFIDSVRQKVTPGTSALFLLSSDAVLDRVQNEFRGTGAEIISTNLSQDQENKLREAFENED